MRRRSSFKSASIIGIIIVILSIIIVGLNSDKFEKIPPNISLGSEIQWNLKAQIPLQITDASGIKSVKISISDGNNTRELMNQTLKNVEKKLNLSITFPPNAIFDRTKNYTLTVQAVDLSKWNFFTGNKAVKSAKLVIDTKKPEIYIINHSYKISKGGSAAVVFGASDENLKDVYVKTSYGKIFKATPFYKNGYYAALLAWPIFEDDFSADVVAIDKAGNKSDSRIRYFLQNRKYKTSKIALNDRFLDGKILDLANEYAKNPDSMDRVAKFKFVNETLRISNENKIREATQNVPEKSINGFYLAPFYPLKNGAGVASFGDHRYYTYNGADISQSWHLGLDLASTANAKISTSNAAIVVFDDKNGIYGNNLILYHGFGLYTLYGHCSSILVKPAEKVARDSVVAITGSTGLALGDHLHFGVLVQGIEVRPEEWMDSKWMKDNIFDILDTSKKIIDKKE